MTLTTIVAGSTGAASAPWWVAPAIIGAFITAAVAIATLIVNGRRGRSERHRTLFADAFGDIAAYQEYVYIVRRRRHDEPEAERVRISTELSEVQRRLNRHRAVLQVEGPRVARSFTALLAATRKHAGAAIRDGWNTAPITADAEIHVNVDLSGIAASEAAFLLAVGDHLALAPWWLRDAARTLRAATRRAWLALRGHSQIDVGSAVEGSVV